MRLKIKASKPITAWIPCISEVNWLRFSRNFFRTREHMLSHSTLKQLQNIVGRESVLNSAEERIAYSYDATAGRSHEPEAVVRPSNAEDRKSVV